MSLIKKKVYSVTALFILVLTFYFATKATSSESGVPVSAITLVGDRIVLQADSKLLTKLRIAPVSELSEAQKYFKAVGQIIALGNPSAIPGAQKVDWVELDDALTREVPALHLAEAHVGDAIGMVKIPLLPYSNKIQEGIRVLVGRYGMTGSGSLSAEGTVLHVAQDLAQPFTSVIFKIENGKTWLPGTNCEVSFPVDAGQGVSISTTSLLHDGVHEYVLKELQEGQFVPQLVTMGEGTQDKVDIVDGLKPGERVVVRGAILLKPLLHELLEKNKP